jgi:hypothetical protein
MELEEDKRLIHHEENMDKKGNLPTTHFVNAQVWNRDIRPSTVTGEYILTALLTRTHRGRSPPSSPPGTGLLAGYQDGEEIYLGFDLGGW